MGHFYQLRKSFSNKKNNNNFLISRTASRLSRSKIHVVQSWKATHLATLDIRVEQKKNLVPKKQFKSLSIPHFQKNDLGGHGGQLFCGRWGSLHFNWTTEKFPPSVRFIAPKPRRSRRSMPHISSNHEWVEATCLMFHSKSFIIRITEKVSED